MFSTLKQWISNWLAPALGDAGDNAFAADESSLSPQLTALRSKFSADDAANVLPDFKGLYEWQLNRSRHAETRAATIQGAVAIAGSLIFAGASLALDRGKINEPAFRWALAGLAALVILAFVGAALRAMQAHMTVQPWTFPDVHKLNGNTVSPLSGPQRVGEYWNAILQNERIVGWKLKRLKQARVHFRNAILLLGLLSVAVFATVVGDTSPEKKPTQVEIVGKR